MNIDQNRTELNRTEPKEQTHSRSSWFLAHFFSSFTVFRCHTSPLDMRQLFNNTEITMPKEQNFSSCHDCVQRCDFSVVVVFVFFKPFFHSFNLTLDEQTKKNDEIFIWNDSGLSHTRIVMHTAVCLCALFCHASQLTTVYMLSAIQTATSYNHFDIFFFFRHTHTNTRISSSLYAHLKNHIIMYSSEQRVHRTHTNWHNHSRIYTRGAHTV